MHVRRILSVATKTLVGCVFAALGVITNVTPQQAQSNVAAWMLSLEIDIWGPPLFTGLALLLFVWAIWPYRNTRIAFRPEPPAWMHPHDALERLSDERLRRDRDEALSEWLNYRSEVEKRRAEFDAMQRSQQPPLPERERELSLAIYTDGSSRLLGHAQMRLEGARFMLVREFYRKLQSGELVAKGYAVPHAPRTEPVDPIPHDEWNFLKIDFERQLDRATGEGIEYMTVRIRKP